MGWREINNDIPEKTDVLIRFENGNVAVGFWFSGRSGEKIWNVCGDTVNTKTCEIDPISWNFIPV